MSELTRLQLELAAFLRHERALENDAVASAWAARCLTGSASLSPVQQLEVYREQFWLRHTSSLVEDFPGLSGILGQRSWERLVEGYLDRCPPEHFSLRDLGARLPAYVAEQTWLEQHELCQDMAALEWAYVECFDAPDAEPLSATELQQIAPEDWARATCILHPALRLLRVRYPVPELRRALKRAASEGGTVAYPEKDPVNLVVHRRQLSLEVGTVSAGAFALLEEFARGVLLFEAVDAVVAGGHVTESELGAWLTPVLRDFAANGWVTRVALT
ncbi:MAG TPA: DNA-binding domain-containing protein [Polyangiaceae bacterium]|nr:DNA-binding domain-containing protein [Polyangiaceae bacterium]